MWLGIRAPEEEIVKTGYHCCEHLVEAWEYWEVEVLGILGSVVDQSHVVRNTGVVDKANVPGMAPELVEDGDLGLIQIEALQVVNH